MNFVKSIQKNVKGISLILISSLFVAIGQLFWKLSGGNQYLLLAIGFLFYITGAICMIIAFKYGSFSVIHPMLAISYVFSLVLGYLVLRKVISTEKIFGILFIVAGVFFIGGGDN